MEETVKTTEDLRKERITLIESISWFRNKMKFPAIDADEFDAMYDAPIWILQRYRAELAAYAEMKTTLG